MTRAAIIITLRERFSCSPGTLRTLLARTPEWAEIVYVACGASPVRVRELAALLQGGRGRVIEGPVALPQNAARNLGARHASPDAEYLVFIDNDVIVEAGWLEALVSCAMETGAAIVGPLIQEGDPAQRIVHMSGGLYREIDTANGRVAFERHLNAHRQVASLNAPLTRSAPDYVEGHCLLVSRHAFEVCSGWDEGLVTMFEYIDLSLRARQAGLSIMVEPQSVVTYGLLDGMTVEDIPLFLTRWDVSATRASFDHFVAMRNLRHDCELIVYGQNFVRDHRGWVRLFDSGPEWAEPVQRGQLDAAATLDDFLLSLRRNGFSISGCAALDWFCTALEPLLAQLAQRHAPFQRVGLSAAHVLAADGGHVSLLAGALVYPLLRSGGISSDQMRTLAGDAKRHWEFSELPDLLNGMFAIERALPGSLGPNFAKAPAAHLRQAVVLAALAGVQGRGVAHNPLSGVLGMLQKIGFETVCESNAALAGLTPAPTPQRQGPLF